MSEKILNLTGLEIGDIIFSTTPALVSQAIQFVTNSPHSHVSIYVGDGVIVESNDVGVKPKKINITGEDAAGNLVGLPYEDWQSIVILRHSDLSIDWTNEIKSSLSAHLGMDYPPAGAVMGAASGIKKYILYIPLKIYDLFLWLVNKEPVKYDSWCSKLIGNLLNDVFASKLNKEQRKKLKNISPEDLMKFASEIGYAEAGNAASLAVAGTSVKYSGLRSKFISTQNKCYDLWNELSEKNQVLHSNQISARALRLQNKISIFSFVFLLVIFVCALWLFAFPGNRWESAKLLDEIEIGQSQGFLRNLFGEPKVERKITFLPGKSLQYERYGNNKSELQFIYADGQLIAYSVINFEGGKIKKSFWPLNPRWVFGEDTIESMPQIPDSTVENLQASRTAWCDVRKYYFGRLGDYKDYYLSTPPGQGTDKIPNALLVADTTELCLEVELDLNSSPANSPRETPEQERHRLACQQSLMDFVCANGRESVE